MQSVRKTNKMVRNFSVGSKFHERSVFKVNVCEYVGTNLTVVRACVRTSGKVNGSLSS